LCLWALGKIAGTSLLQRNLVRNLPVRAKSIKAFKRSPNGPRRTAIGVDQANRRLVHLVVSREPVTLFELATFMVNGLHCSEGLHLDGDLSAFYIPSTPKRFLFFDPGERIVTALSIIDRETRTFENKKPSGSTPKR
jgi:hypothetical protein